MKQIIDEWFVKRTWTYIQTYGIVFISSSSVSP